MDGSAIGLSGLCLLHCLALPIAASLLPVLGPWTHAEWVHLLFVGLAAPVAAWALLRPAHGAQAPVPMVLAGIAGVLLLLAGAFAPESLETPITVAGSVTLAAAHVWNWRRRGACGTPPCGA